MNLKMRKLEAVIFDMDGLMLDTERLAIPSLRRAAEGMGIYLTDAILLEMNGLNENDANLLMDKRLGITVPKKEFSDAFYADYEQSLASGIPLKEGLIALIDCLEEHHIRLAVATSTKIDLALKKLESVGIRERFEVIIGGDQVAQGKPAPDPYAKAAQALGIHVDHCLALEDSDNGAMSAFSAGISVIVVPDITPPSENTQRIALSVHTSLVEVREYLLQHHLNARKTI